MTPRVSAIVIFLDAERFLEEAIESVFAQTADSWELLLCDDGSRDGSTAIARAWAERFPERVRYLEHERHENRGMSATRNLGLRHARGEYVAWLDADDAWLPEKLERQLRLLDDWPEAAMVCGRARYWYSWTGESGDARRDFEPPVAAASGTLVEPPRLLLRFLRDEHLIPADVMVRRSALAAVGGFEEAFRDEFEDVLVHAKLCLSSPVLLTDDCFYLYRQHEGSCTAETRRTFRERSRRLVFLRRLAGYLAEQGVREGEVWDAVQEGLELNRGSSRVALAEGVGRSRQRLLAGYWRAGRTLRVELEKVLPPTARAWLAVRLRGDELAPPPGWIDFGAFRRTTPINRRFGKARGTPCDRYYVERFLEAHADDVRGRVLEIGREGYARRLAAGRAAAVDDVYPGPAHGAVPTGPYDCVILTRGFSSPAELETTVAATARALVPGGVLLAALPGVSQLRADGPDGSPARFTPGLAERCLARHLDAEALQVDGYGNALTALAHLHGLAAQELTAHELAHHEPGLELIVGVRAVKRSR